MNVIFLTLSHIKDINVSGIYTDLIRKFRDEGHNVYIVCPFERKYKLKTTLIAQDGVKILGVKTFNIQKTNYVEKFFGTALLSRQFKKAIKQYYKDISFDLILYSTPPLSILHVVKGLRQMNPFARSYLLLKDIHPQAFIDLQILTPNGFLSKKMRSLEQQLYSLSDNIGCMSPANVQYVIDHNPSIPVEKIELAPNSIDLSILPYSIPQKRISGFNLSEDSLVFVYGGNIGIAQCVEFIISCLELYKNNDKLYFVIVGGGTEFHKLTSWYRKNNSPNNILIKPMLPRIEYENLMSSCDVGLIFLDHRFTFPNYPSRLLSYLSKKIPVLVATDTSTDIGKLAEANEYGLWCESNDVCAFAECIDTYQKMPKAELRRMGQNGYQYLLENYQVDNTYDAIMSHF